MSALGRQRTWSQGQFTVAVVSEKEQFQVKSRPRVKLWEWSLEDEKDKESNGQWLDDPYEKKHTKKKL